MAFCPECGKSVAADDATCAGCGKKLQREGKRGRPQRFNGTMMMASPLGARAEQPANVNAELPAEQDAAVAAAAGTTSPRLGGSAAAKRSHRPPGPSAHPASARAGAAEARSKGMHVGTSIAVGGAPQKSPSGRAPKNATMLGPALAPTTPRSKPPPGAKSKKPSPAPEPRVGLDREKPASGASSVRASQRAGANVQALQSTPVSDASSKPAATTALEQRANAAGKATQSEASPATTPHSARPADTVAEIVEPKNQPSAPRAALTQPMEYLPGDPMAPQPSAAKRAPRGPRPTHRINVDDEIAGHDGNYVTLYWAICVAVVFAVGALAFRLF